MGLIMMTLCWRESGRECVARERKRERERTREDGMDDEDDGDDGRDLALCVLVVMGLVLASSEKMVAMTRMLILRR